MTRVGPIELSKPSKSRLACCVALCVSALLAACAAPGSAADDAAFDAVAVPDSVVEALDAARAGNPLWTPKFKTLSYTRKTKDSDRQETVDVEALPDGLLRRRSVSGPFDLQGLSFGGFFTLKMRIGTSSDTPMYAVASKLKLDLPAELKPGAVLASELEMERWPPDADAPETHLISKCEVKERLAASAFLPTLTGQVVRMDCQSSGKYVNNSTQGYFEDLGLFIPLGNPAADGSFSAVITSMGIER